MADLRPGPLTVLAKLPARVRARGFREVASLGLQRVGEAIRSEDRLIFFLRATTGEGDPGDGSPLTLRQAGSEHASIYQRDIGTDSAATFSRRLAQGTRCYLVLEEDKALHASWVTTTASWVREMGRYFRPPAGHAYVYESFTRADARGRGVYPFALRGICRELATDRIDWLWVAVEEGNAPSLKAVSKAGFETAFEVAYGRRFGRLSVSQPTGQKVDLCANCIARKLSE